MINISLISQYFAAFLEKYAKIPINQVLRDKFKTIDSELETTEKMFSLEYDMRREYYEIFGIKNVPRIIDQEKYVNDMLSLTAFKSFKTIHEIIEDYLKKAETDLTEKGIYFKLRKDNNLLFIKIDGLYTGKKNHINDNEFCNILEENSTKFPYSHVVIDLLIDAVFQEDITSQQLSMTKALREADTRFPEKKDEIILLYNNYKKRVGEFLDSKNRFITQTKRTLSNHLGLTNSYIG